MFFCGKMQILASWNETLLCHFGFSKSGDKMGRIAAGETEQLAAGVIFEVSERYYANGSLHDVAFCLL